MILYRAEVAINMWDDSCVTIHEHNVDKETPQGYWIIVYGTKKWVSNHGKKRFAYPNHKLAIESLWHRLNRRENILSGQLKEVIQNRKHLEDTYKLD